MKDGFERRALLLHLGEVMETVACLLSREGGQGSAHRVAQAARSFASLPLLEHVSPHMTPVEFAQRANAAFCTWPSELLEVQLNRVELAATVQQHLFAGNPSGWRAYVDELRPEVPWFGDDVPEFKAPAAAVSTALADTTETGALKASHVESGDNPKAHPRESTKDSEPIYLSWPWKRDP
jgi:hypothetical protein